MKISGMNMTMVRGDSEKVTVNCTDINKVQIPFVEGDIVCFTVKESVHEPDEESKIRKEITTFVSGKAEIYIEPEDTVNMDFKTYVYDVQLIKMTPYLVDGEVNYREKVTTVIPVSNFTLAPEVTHRIR